MSVRAARAPCAAPGACSPGRWRSSCSPWLVAAVAHYLRGGPTRRVGIGHAMHMHAADALDPRPAASPLGPLLGRALVTRVAAGRGRAGRAGRSLAAWYLTGVALVPGAHPGSAGRCAARVRSSPAWRSCAFATNGSIAVYDQVLFTAHMAGHLALVMLAPALLVAGRPLTLALAAAPPAAPRPARARRSAAGSSRC